MTDLQRDCLRMLRTFGPCSNADVGRKLGVAPDTTYRAIGQLVLLGLVAHPKLQRWQITQRGRNYFAQMPAKPLELMP